MNNLDDGGLSSLVILSLIVLHGFIRLAHTALTNVRLSSIRDEAEEGDQRAQHVLDLVSNLARLNITYQLSLILIWVAMTAVATLNIAQPLIAANPAVSPLVVYLGVLGAITLAVVLVGDLLPAALGSARADGLSRALAGPMRFFVLLLSPLVRVITFIGQGLASLFGGDVMEAAVTEEEIMTLVDAGQKEGTIENQEKEMIISILQLDETLAREVMVPRMDIVALEVNTPLGDALAKFVTTGHSRIPIYHETIDNIEGLLYAKDLLTMMHNGNGKPKTIRELMRPAHFVPESLRADLLLKELRQSKIHMAIVVDEYGGTAGLVTIENLIEEIIGDIQDEYDLNEEVEYTELTADEYLIDASMDLDDLNGLLDVELPTDENDTLGGLIYSRIGRVPRVGEVIEETENKLMLVVESVDGRRIRKVRVTRIKPEAQQASDGDTAEAEDTQEQLQAVRPAPDDEPTTHASRRAG